MEEKKSLNFFERVFYSIFKFDRYDLFINEKPGVAIRYILVLTLLITLFCSFIEVFDFMRVYKRGRDYILENRLPEFVYNDGKLTFSKNVENYDEETKYYFCANTNELSDDEINEVTNKTIDYKYALILFKDKLILSFNGAKSEYEYKQYDSIVDMEGLDNQKLISTFNDLSPTKVFGMIFSMISLSVFIVQALGTLLNILFLFISAMLICRFINLAINDSSKFNIACYSITLSIVLTAIYNIFYFCTNIEIKNMDTVYLILAYIYLIASLFIIKQEVSKQKIEIKKTVKEEKGKTVEELEKEKEETKKELEKNKEKKEEKKNNGKKEDKDSDLSSKKVPNNGEPDGSEI